MRQNFFSWNQILIFVKAWASKVSILNENESKIYLPENKFSILESEILKLLKIVKYYLKIIKFSNL